MHLLSTGTRILVTTFICFRVYPILGRVHDNYHAVHFFPNIL